MNKSRALILAALSTAMLGIAVAAPAPVAIPASSSIAAKLDFAKARSLPATGQAIAYLFAEVHELRKASRLLSQSFGVDVNKDLSSVVAFSDGFTFNGERVSLQEASSIASGNFDTARMAAAVRGAKGFESARVGSVEVMTAEFSRGYWVAFPEGKVLASSSKYAIAKAAKMLSNGADASQGFLARAIAADCPAVVAMDGSKGMGNLTTLTGGLLKADAEKVVAKLTEKNPGTARLEIEMTFASGELATQTFTTINGIKMLTAFKQAKDPDSSPLLQRLVEADVSCNGNVVSFAMSMTAGELAKLNGK